MISLQLFLSPPPPLSSWGKGVKLYRMSLLSFFVAVRETQEEEVHQARRPFGGRCRPLAIRTTSPASHVDSWAAVAQLGRAGQCILSTEFDLITNQINRGS